MGPKETVWLCLPTATAVPGIQDFHFATALAPLWDVWQSLCRMLPSKGPLLCLGWEHLHPIPAEYQTVWLSVLLPWEANMICVVPGCNPCEWWLYRSEASDPTPEVCLANLFLLFPNRRFRRQDVRNGDPSILCSRCECS